jgi:GNAT superfamily N-acetyltransferase
LLRDLYAAAAEGWAKAGAERHYVLVPALNDALQPWYRLGFGHMHVEALRPIGIEHRSPPDGVRLRAGTRADLEVAEDLDLEIFNLQARSPSFAGLSLDREARRREWLEINLNEEGLRYLVAEANGDLVGHTLIFRPEPVFGVPSNAASLVSTVVREGERGRGIGEAMLSEILRLAAEAGYGSVFTNWRMTNLSASRFWPALGFQPIYHRLHRKIGSG